jgi:hypothetical protein
MPWHLFAAHVYDRRLFDEIVRSVSDPAEAMRTFTSSRKDRIGRRK